MSTKAKAKESVSKLLPRREERSIFAVPNQPKADSKAVNRDSKAVNRDSKAANRVERCTDAVKDKTRQETLPRQTLPSWRESKGNVTKQSKAPAAYRPEVLE